MEMTDQFTYRKEYKLTKGYTVEFSLSAIAGPVTSLEAVWSPRVPPSKIVKGKFLEAYRNARNDFVGSLGMNSMVVEA
jgi:hypothetical protein